MKFRLQVAFPCRVCFWKKSIDCDYYAEQYFDHVARIIRPLERKDLDWMPDATNEERTPTKAQKKRSEQPTTALKDAVETGERAPKKPNLEMENC
jgi:hypothetical protein